MKQIKPYRLAILACFSTVFSFGQDQEEQLFTKLRNDIKSVELTGKGNVETIFRSFSAEAGKLEGDSTLVKGIHQLTSYYIAHNNYYEAIRWYSLAADSLCKENLGPCTNTRRQYAKIFEKANDYKTARKYYFENIRLLKAKERWKGIALDFGSIATTYVQENNNHQAEFYYKRGLEFSKKSGITFFLVDAYNNLGVFYFRQHKNELAKKYYELGIQELEKNTVQIKNPIQYGLLQGNLGAIYLEEGDTAKGIPLLMNDIKRARGTNESSLAVNALIELARFYYAKGNYTRALFHLKDALTLVDNPQNESIVHLELFRNYLKLSQNKQAYDHFNQFNNLKTTFELEENKKQVAIEKSLVSNILTTQLDYVRKKSALKQQENDILQRESKMNQFITVLSIAFGSVVVVFLVYFFRKRISLLRISNELAEKKLLLEKIEKEKLDQELHYKNKDLTDFAIDSARKQDILKEIKDRLTQIKQLRDDPEQGLKAINELILYTNSNMLVDENLIEFQTNIEEINYKFFDTLKLQFSDLTELDMQVCGLIRLGLSNKEIASMRNVSYKAVKMSRYRIRKKLNLGEEDDMVQFLKSI